MAEYKREIGTAVVIAVVLAAFLATLAISTTPLSTSISHSQSTTASSAYCLIQIPADSRTSHIVNSTFNGEAVTYPNGTQEFFSSYSCPQPAPGETNSSALPLAKQGISFTTDIYSMAAAAESNSSFVAAENGSQFLFGKTSGLGCNLSSVCNLELYFFSYGSVENPCGNSSLYVRTTTSGIMVGFNTTTNYAEGAGANQVWNLSDPTIQPIPTSDLAMYVSDYTCGP